MKNKNVFKRVLTILAFIIGIALLVIYVIFPNEFKSTAKLILDFLNAPLPVVGVSLVVLGVFVLKMVKYIRNTKPSQELREMRDMHKEYVENSEKEKQDLKDQNKEFRGFIAHVCELSTNQKIKNYGKELLSYGEEETEVERKAKEM